MSLTATTIRMESDLKVQFDNLCSEFGMSANTAFNVFAKAVVRSRSIPFTISTSEESAAETGRKAFRSIRADMAKKEELTLDEINKEISEYRTSKR